MRPRRTDLLLLLSPAVVLAADAGCLHWVPEEEPADDDSAAADDDDATPDDDDTTADDDDATPDDDDATGPLEADAAGLLVVMDTLTGQGTQGVVGGVLFSSASLAPCAEEAVLEDLFGVNFPLFAEPGEPRELPAGDNYQVEPESVGDLVFVNAGSDSAALGWNGIGYTSGEQGIPLPGLVDGAAWILQVPGEDEGVPWGGFHSAPRLPPSAWPWFGRVVGDRVYLPFGAALEAQAEPADEATDLLIVRREGAQGIAFAPWEDGSVWVGEGVFPQEWVKGGSAEMAWYRVARTREETVAGSLMLATARWTQMSLQFLPPGVAYFFAQPAQIPMGEPVEFSLFGEGVAIEGDGPVSVQVGNLFADQAWVVAPDQVQVSFSDGIQATGVLDLWVSWEGGQGRGGVVVLAEAQDCDLSESEPNDWPSGALFFVPGLVACGHVNPPADVDYYRFAATTGTTYQFETLAGRLGYATDTTLTLFDPSGAQVAFADDSFENSRDSMITWTATSPGQPLLQVASWQNQVGGPDHYYQLLTQAL